MLESVTDVAGVTSDEAEQYMDIIRNLILGGITPAVLIKRGATRRYVTAVCQEIVESSKRQSTIWTETRDREDTGTPDTTMPVAEPSRLPSGLSSPSPEAVDMVRDVSSGSHSSLDVNDEVDRMLSLPQCKPQKLVPASSWSPGRATEALTRSAPSIRIESYKPAAQSAVFASSPVAPGQISTTSKHGVHAIALDPVSIRPRPVSSYVPTGPRASSSQPTRLGTSSPLDPSALAFTPQKAVSIPSAEMEVDSVAPITISETLAERKRRVLESMKRGRKPKPVESGPSTGTITPIAILEDASPTPPILAPTPKLASKADLQDEVAALEREVMQLQENRPPVQLEPEEGEIIASNTPSPAKQTLQLPVQPPVKSTNLLNGARLNRATKRPAAEDLMDGRATSSKVAYPVKRKFGRPVGWAKLQVSLDDSDDEDQPASPAVPSPIDRDQAKLDEEIRLLREQILRRRLAQAAKAKAAKVAIGTSTNRAEPPARSEAKAATGLIVTDGDIVMRETWRPDGMSQAFQSRDDVLISVSYYNPCPHG